jgi:hypothetical protein
MLQSEQQLLYNEEKPFLWEVDSDINVVIRRVVKNLLKDLPSRRNSLLLMRISVPEFVIL